MPLFTDEWWGQGTDPELKISLCSLVASEHAFLLQSEKPFRKTRREQ